MAANKKHYYWDGTISTERLEYAKMLLSWSDSLETEQTLLEDYELRYWKKRESAAVV